MASGVDEEIWEDLAASMEIMRVKWINKVQGNGKDEIFWEMEGWGRTQKSTVPEKCECSGRGCRSLFVRR